LRDKAKRLLEREAKTRGDAGEASFRTLAEIEADLSAFLDGR
jgi:hypothetical protein